MRRHNARKKAAWRESIAKRQIVYPKIRKPKRGAVDFEEKSSADEREPYEGTVSEEGAIE